MVDKDFFKKLLESPRTFATTLTILLMDLYGTEYFTWESETLQMEMADTFNAEMPIEVADKIQAAVTLLSTDSFYRTPDAFIHIANAFNDSGADFDTWDPATVDECAWAVVEASLLDPAERGQKFYNQFFDEVKRYIGTMISSEGMARPPQTLEFAMMPEDPTFGADTLFDTDEAMYKMFFDRAKKEQLEVEDYVNQRLAALANEIKTLVLFSGDRSSLQQVSDGLASIALKRSQETQAEAAGYGLLAPIL